jgi:HAD superfamily hydrolase (TIGR01450 family)
MGLADAKGFMFDLDGTLAQRSPEGLRAMPGAADVLDAIRASGRPLVIFTNASDADPREIADRARRGGLGVTDEEVLTAACSSLGHLRRNFPAARVLVIANEGVKRRIADAGFELETDELAHRAEVVLTQHVDEIRLEVLEGAARAVFAGAAFLTSNYARAYAGLNGPILSRGAMVTAAIAKGSGRRPTIVGKPSRAAVREIEERLGVDPRRVAFVGDDLGMDVALGRLAKGTTVLVRSGMDGPNMDRVPTARRPDLVLDGVEDLLDLL